MLAIKGLAAWAGCSILSHIPSVSTFPEHGFCSGTFFWSRRFPLSTSLISSFFSREIRGKKHCLGAKWLLLLSHPVGIWIFPPESCPDLCLQVLKFKSLFNLDSFRYLLVQLGCTKTVLAHFPSVLFVQFMVMLCSSRMFLPMSSTLFEERVLAIRGIVLIPEYIFPFIFFPIKSIFITGYIKVKFTPPSYFL